MTSDTKQHEQFCKCEACDDRRAHDIAVIFGAKAGEYVSLHHQTEILTDEFN